MSFSFQSINLCILFLLLAMPFRALAATADLTLLDVEIRVPDQTAKVQNAAFTSGLQQVLVRLSGDSKVLSKIKLPPARRYVKQFRYDTIEADPTAGQQAPSDIPQLQLWIQYDEDRLQSLLRNNGIPVWNSNRDPAVVWFAVRDGLQYYILRDADESQLKLATDTAAASRGVPLVWPRYDAADRNKLRFADVWGGFQSELRQASNRYVNGPVIAANMAWTGTGWVGEWYLYDSSISRYWMIENADYATVISMGMDHVADELGTRYALLDDVDIYDASHLRVAFQGVNSVQAYKKVSKILMDLPSVKATQAYGVAGDSATFDVFLRTDEHDFLDRMKRQPGLLPLLQPVEVPGEPVESLPSADGGTTPTQVPTAVEPVQRYSYRLLHAGRL